MTGCSDMVVKKATFRQRYALLTVAGIIAAIPAGAQIAVVVHPASRAGTMPPDHIALYFQGKSNALTPLEQDKHSAIRRRFYQQIGNMTLSQIESNWARLEFTGRGAAPQTYPSDAAIKKAMAGDQSAIGYINKVSVDKTVKVILVLP